MRGHAAIIAMRRRGVRPRVVFLDLDHAYDFWCHHWPRECPIRAHVCIGPDELVSGLDLRFCVGLTVLVTGSNAARVERVTAACMEAGAARAVGVHVTTTEDHSADFGRRAVVHSINDRKAPHAAAQA